MPPQNTEDIAHNKSQHGTNGTTTPNGVNGQLNNNQDKDAAVKEKLLKGSEDANPPTTAVIVPPDGTSINS